MRNVRILVGVMLCTLLLSVLTFGISAQTYPDHLANVIDKDDVLIDSQEQEINAALAQAREQAGVPICVYVFVSERGERYWGDDFLADYGLSSQTDLVLLVVEVTRYEINYYMYTYGDAYYQINQKELNYILDDSTVYNNIKTGAITEGICAYAQLSAEAYAGRLGVSWRLILIVALIIGAIVGAICIKSIQAGYQRKNPSQSYPLDRFAQLNLTKQNDRVIGKFVTTTIISSGGRGGHGGRPGGGGGGGYRGGR